MKFFIMAALLAVAMLTATSAEARNSRHHHHYRHHHHRAVADANGNGTLVSHPAGCPGRAFCGCGVAVKIFGHPVRDLYLASNWYKFPRATPGPGMVAVRRHHVMAILSYSGGGVATVYDPNSGGHATRIHQRSLAGYTVVNPRYASR